MVYRFVIISAEDDSFLREFELEESNTLLDFHNEIQEELEFDRTHIASFFTVTKNWEKEEEFTLFEMGANTTLMEDVTIDDIAIEKNQKLLYVFDLFNERSLFIECIGKVKKTEGREYPSCTRSKGKPPEQVLLNDFHSNLKVIPFEDEEYGIDEDDDLPGLENIDDFDDL